MSWIEDATKVLAEGMTPEGKRMQIIAEPVEHGEDLKPDGDGYVPTFYMGYSYGAYRLSDRLNISHFPVSEEATMEAVVEVRERFRDNWEKMAERWLRIMGAKDARVREVQLDQSSWGIMVSAFGQDWQDMTGVTDDYTITAEDAEDFENWLKGEVSWVSARVASHDCNCEYCEVEWVDMDDVPGMTVYADSWDIRRGITWKYAYVVDAMVAESWMIRQEVTA